jgi:hypothetical protein
MEVTMIVANRSVPALSIPTSDWRFDTLNQQIAREKLVVEQDRQLVVSDQAALVFSRQNYQRDTELAKTGAGSVKNPQGVTADIREKEATLQHDTTGVGAAPQQIAVYEAQLASGIIGRGSLRQRRTLERRALARRRRNACRLVLAQRSNSRSTAGSGFGGGRILSRIDMARHVAVKSMISSRHSG